MNDLKFEMDYTNCICEACKNDLNIVRKEKQLDYDIISIELPTEHDNITLSVEVDVKALTLIYEESKEEYNVSLEYTTKCFHCCEVRNFKTIIDTLPKVVIQTIFKCKKCDRPLTIQSIKISWRDMQDQQNKTEINAELYCKRCKIPLHVKDLFTTIISSNIGSLQKFVIDFLNSKIKIE